MADSGEEHVGESSSSGKRLKRQSHFHRHSEEQIQRLEAFFKECRHPDENQRKQLGKEVGLDPNQVKFWFQNKRTQTKSLNERSDNNTLRTENERFYCENMAIKEALKNIICPHCDGPPIGEEERIRNLQKMKMENQRMRDEHERISRLISSVVGNSFVMNSNLAPPNSSDGILLSQKICDSFIEYPPPSPPQENNNNNNIPIISSSPQENYEFHHEDRERSIIFKIVVSAIDEIVELLQVDEPIWMRSSPSDERYFIHQESYVKLFPNSQRPYKSSSARIESSKNSGVVSMTAIELIHIFIDPIKRMNMFPTMVAKSRTIEVLDTGSFGGSIQLMYEKLHVLSPLVGAREFFFISCCRQLDPTTWIMVNVSYDIFKEIQSDGPSHSWKFPSGCIIQDLGNGKSQVTWLEHVHVQVDDKNQTHRIYRELVDGCQTYGAKRWITTLQRMSERYNFAQYPATHHLGEVGKNVMQISERMVKSFCEILSMTDKFDFPSSLMNSRDRISIRKNDEITQPKGLIVTATTSLWLPLSFATLFNFFKDEKTRPQWDIFSNDNAVNVLAQVLTGTFPGNCITIIQPCVPMEENILVLQETNIDQMGAFVIFAPINLSTVNSINNGEDTTKIPMLPSGFIISPDGRLTADRDTTGNTPNGSILTVAFQVLICADDNISISQKQNMEAVATVHTLLSSTVIKIKAALDCSD